MYKFKNIKHSTNELELFASCQIDHDQAFFQGHFVGLPLMPAAAQMQMVEVLIHEHSKWVLKIVGGKNIKFTQRIVPNDLLDIHLIKKDNKTIQFNLTKQNSGTATNGYLMLEGENHG